MCVCLPDLVWYQGETPHTVTLVCHSNLVDVARPGDRVEITGVFRAQPQRVSSRKRSTRAVYNTYIDVLHIRKVRRALWMKEGMSVSHLARVCVAMPCRGGKGASC